MPEAPNTSEKVTLPSPSELVTELRNALFHTESFRTGQEAARARGDNNVYFKLPGEPGTYQYTVQRDVVKEKDVLKKIGDLGIAIRTSGTVRHGKLYDTDDQDRETTTINHGQLVNIETRKSFEDGRKTLTKSLGLQDIDESFKIEVHSGPGINPGDTVTHTISRKGKTDVYVYDEVIYSPYRMDEWELIKAKKALGDTQYFIRRVKKTANPPTTANS